MNQTLAFFPLRPLRNAAVYTVTVKELALRPKHTMIYILLQAEHQCTWPVNTGESNVSGFYAKQNVAST